MENEEKPSLRDNHESSSISPKTRVQINEEKNDLPRLTEPENDAQTADTNLDEWEYVTGIKLVAVVVAVTAACFVMLLDTSIIATAIPKITSEFHSLQDIGWYGSAFLLANCTMQPMAGKLYSQFKSKHAFIFFIGLFEIGSLLCGVAKSSKMLIVGRAVAGMGGSGLMNGALTILSACIPLEKGAMYFGIMSGVAQLGILFGPLLGGALTQYTTWRWCFYINLPIGGVVIAFLYFLHIPDRRAKSQVKTTVPSILDSLDLPGFALFAPGAIMFLLALQWGGIQYKWSSATIIGLFCGAAAMLVVFLAWEYRRGETAMIPLSMLKIRIVWCSCLAQFFFAGSLYTYSYYMAIYFQTVRGVAPMLSGVDLLPSILSQMFAAIFVGFLISRLGYYLPWAIGSGAITTIGSGLLSSLTPHTTTVAWIFYQIISGFGRGCGMQIPIVAVQNTLSHEQTSVGLSVLIFCQGFGGAIFQSFAQTTLTNGLKNALPHFAPGVDAQTIISVGASGIRDNFSKADLYGIILAYNQAINHVFYLIAGAAAGVFIFAWGLGWKSVKKAKAVKPEA